MADAEAAPIDTADEQASEANVVGEVSADSEEPRTQLFAAFESDVARVGKPAPVAHLVDRIQADIAKLRDTYDKSRGELEINVSRLDQRKEAVSKKLDEFSALTKDASAGCAQFVASFSGWFRLSEAACCARSQCATDLRRSKNRWTRERKR